MHHWNEKNGGFLGGWAHNSVFLSVREGCCWVEGEKPSTRQFFILGNKGLYKTGGGMGEMYIMGCYQGMGNASFS